MIDAMLILLIGFTLVMVLVVAVLAFGVVGHLGRRQ